MDALIRADVPLRVLMIEDSVSDAALNVRALETAGYRVAAVRAETAHEMKAALAEQAFEIVLADNRLPQFDAMGALAVLKESGLDIPFIIVSGSMGEEVAVEMLRAGANDYVLKDRLYRLAVVVERALVDVEERRKRKHVEQALRLARFSIDHASDYIMWIDSEGRFTDVSESFCTRLGYSRDELLAMPISDTDVATATAEAWPEQWRELKEHGPLTFEREYRTKNGETFPVEVRSMIFEHEGREYDCGIARDITERKQAEEALKQSEEHLRQSQKMEAVGLLAGGIAHDFNNLLTAILGYSDLILSSGSSTVDEVRPDMEEIKRAGERASALTHQILAFSRRQTLRPEVVLLDEVIRGIEPLLRRTIGEDIDLQITESPGLTPAEVDPHQFEQVVMNLVINARDAMSSGGRLTVETGTVELDEEFCRFHADTLPGSYVMLRVSDTGVGMDAATQERIFEPFFTTKAPGAGTGLGLATVYGIVEQSHGSMFVTSEPGQGSSFAIYLPRVVQPEVPEGILIPPQASARGHETVMVVEDEKALRGLIERILGAAGYTTLIFGSAEGALKALEQEEQVVDMLLTDVMLPGPIQGHDLARATLALRPHLPVLYISGYARDALVHSGRLDEGVNLLEKPFTQESLTAMVREVLNMSRGSGRGV